MSQKPKCVIFILEDDEAYRQRIIKGLKTVLDDYDLEIHWFRDRQSALEFLRRRDRPHINIAILDYKTPARPEIPDSGADGSLEVTEYCIKAKCSTGVIQLSAFAAEPTLVQFWKQCADQGVRGRLVQKGSGAVTQVCEFIRTCIQFRDFVHPLQGLSMRGALNWYLPSLAREQSRDQQELRDLAEGIRRGWASFTEKTREDVRILLSVTEENGDAIVSLKCPMTQTKEADV